MTSTSTRVIVDADILIKLSVLDVFEQCLHALGYRVDQCATMQSMKFSAGLTKPAVRERKAGAGLPAQRLLETLRRIPSLDPTTAAETALAAEMVRQSQRLGLAIDGGEAIVMSVCILRKLDYVTTGDKKAVRSLPLLEPAVPVIGELRQRVVPLECMLLRLLERVPYSSVRPRLDAGAYCDTAVRRALEQAGADGRLFVQLLTDKAKQLASQAPRFLAL